MRRRLHMGALWVRAVIYLLLPLTHWQVLYLLLGAAELLEVGLALSVKSDRERPRPETEKAPALKPPRPSS